MTTNSSIHSIIQKSIEVKEALLADTDILAVIEEIVYTIVDTYRKGGKVLLCGNGGSAADAQHIAAELSGRYYLDREPLYAEALHVNTSYITAVANDYGYNFVYSRLIEAMGTEGDVLIAISTSGNSENIVEAVNAATKAGMTTIALTGEGGGKLKDTCTYAIQVPSTDTPRVQECHILIGHVICELVEKILFATEEENEQE